MKLRSTIKNEIRKYVSLIRNDPLFLLRWLLSVSKKGNRIILVGTPTHGNVGDHIIAAAVKGWFNDAFKDACLVEITMHVARGFLREIIKSLKPGDMIVISGGGWMGSEWPRDESFIRNVLDQSSQIPVVIMPQTMFYKNHTGYMDEGIKIYSLKKDLLTCFRERYSYECYMNNGFYNMQQEFKPIVMPDMAMYFHKYTTISQNQREGEHILLCLREDREKNDVDNYRQYIKKVLNNKMVDIREYTTVEKRFISVINRKRYIEKKINEVMGCRVLITDRLHAMIIALITGTPCIVFDNTTHKVRGVYEWIRNVEYIQLITEMSDFEFLFESLLNMKDVNKFDSHAWDHYLLELRNKISGLRNHRIDC